MDTVKLSVTVELQGRTMLTSQECDKNPEENYIFQNVTVISHYYDKRVKKTVTQKKIKKIPIGRKCIPAYQTINISDDAYNYMISLMHPEWFKGSLNDWKRLSKKEKLEIHLQRICDSLNGKSYTYTVFND